MVMYKNFTVDFPKRIAELDPQFRQIASNAELEVSYMLMKLAASFLLPYERIEGVSGAKKPDIANPQLIRKHLELDKMFCESTYFSDFDNWASIEVDGFDRGPVAWFGNETPINFPVHKVLVTIRHSVAHSNLFFGGGEKIEHVYLGSRKEKDPETGKYRVVRCSIGELEHFIEKWIFNVQKLRTSPYLIWQEIENPV